jgi:hypothetical protein
MKIPAIFFALVLAAVSFPATAATKKPAATPASSARVSQAQAQTNPVAVLQTFTLADLQAALADAQGQNPPDTVAATCYQALIALVSNPAANPLPASPGAFQLFQKARDLKNLIAAMQSPNGPLTGLNIACAPLILDSQNTLIQLGIMGGAVAGSLIP